MASQQKGRRAVFSLATQELNQTAHIYRLLTLQGEWRWLLQDADGLQLDSHCVATLPCNEQAND